MNEDGAEHLYSTDINEPIVNFGVSVLAATPGALIDPFVLGSKDENDVQGYAGIPTDVNGLTFDANVDVGAAGGSSRGCSASTSRSTRAPTRSPTSR